MHTLDLEPGCAIVGIERADDLRALDKVLRDEIAANQHVVVISVHCVPAPANHGEGLAPSRIVGDCETDIFSEVVFSAESAGREVKLLAVSGESPMRSLLEAVTSLRASSLWLGTSGSRTIENQEAELQQLWSSSLAMRGSLEVSLVESLDNPVKQLHLTR
jgi:hypothetical protein